MNRDTPPRDDGWRWLSFATILWGFGSAIHIPALIPLVIRAAPAGTAHDFQLLSVGALISILNNYCFIRALPYFPKDAAPRWSSARIASVYSRHILTLLCYIPGLAIAALTVYRNQLGWSDAAFTLFVQVISVPGSFVVLGLYSLELTYALRRRGVASLLFPWFLGVLAQIMTESAQVAQSFLVASSDRPDLPLWNIALPVFVVGLISILSQALICLTLIGQAVSWFTETTRTIAGDLRRVYQWLSRVREMVDDSPLAESLDGVIETLDARNVSSLPAVSTQHELPVDRDSEK